MAGEWLAVGAPSGSQQRRLHSELRLSSVTGVTGHGLVPPPSSSWSQPWLGYITVGPSRLDGP